MTKMVTPGQEPPHRNFGMRYRRRSNARHEQYHRNYSSINALFKDCIKNLMTVKRLTPPGMMWGLIRLNASHITMTLYF
jgi:hypothetical protein